MAKQDTTPTPSTADALDALTLDTIEGIPAGRTDGESGGSLYYRVQPTVEAHGGRGNFAHTKRTIPMQRIGNGPRDFARLASRIVSPASERGVICENRAYYLAEFACKCHTYGDPDGAVLYLAFGDRKSEASTWLGCDVANADAVRAEMRRRARRA